MSTTFLGLADYLKSDTSLPDATLAEMALVSDLTSTRVQAVAALIQQTLRSCDMDMVSIVLGAVWGNMGVVVADGLPQHQPLVGLDRIQLLQLVLSDAWRSLLSVVVAILNK